MPPSTLTALTPCPSRKSATTAGARADLADDVQRPLAAQLVEPGGHGTHRYVLRPGDVTRGLLVVLTHVDEPRVTAVERGLQIHDADVHRTSAFHLRCSGSP